MIDTHFRDAPPSVGDRVDGGTFVDIDGDLLWHFQGGDPMGPPTVLLHGSFSSASSWGAQFGDFADAGHVCTRLSAAATVTVPSVRARPASPRWPTR